MIIRSSIQSKTLKKSLYRGTILAATGALLLLLSGTLLPKSLLLFLGAPTLITSSLLIGLGLLPYRKLSRLQLKPFELSTDGKTLFFSKSGKLFLKIPHLSIERIDYCEKNGLYGISLRLKRPILEKVIVVHPIDLFSNPFGGDLFFPYFSERSCRELKELFTAQLG